MRNVHAIARRHVFAAVAGLMVLATVPAAAQDKVKVGVFPVSSSLPYFVALERGFFKEQNIEPEMVRLIGGPPNVAAMITNQIDAAAVLVTIEGMNADLKKPGVAMYISLNSQNKTYQMEQFVVRKGYPGELAQGPQGREDHVGARTGQRDHGESGLGRGGSQGRRLHHRSARHGAACQRHAGGHLRRRLHARAERLHHAQDGYRQHDRGGRDRALRSGRPQCQCVRRRLRA